MKVLIRLILLVSASVMITHAQPICIVGRTLCTGTVSSSTTSGGYSTVQANGVATTQWPTLNLIGGSNMTISCVSNTGQMKTDCTFVSTGGGSGSSAFSGLTTSTNNSAVMTCGSGCSMLTSGTGVISATSINGVALSGLVGRLASFGASNTILDSGLAADRAVLASSTTPAAGVAHFQGLGPIISSSLIVNADITDGTINLVTKTAGILPASNGGSGVATITGIIRGNGAAAFSNATSSDVISLFTGPCIAGTYLGGDGICTTPSGSGTVNSGTGTHLAFYASTGAAVSDMGTEFTFSSVTHTLTSSAIGVVDLHLGKFLPAATTVGALPTASTNTGAEYLITDGQTKTDCFSGGGTARLHCVSNGTQWVSISNIVNSVSLTLPVSTFITSATLVGDTAGVTGTFATQAANTVFAGPVIGAAAVPTWRTLSTGDIPTITSVNGVSFPASPSTHSVYVITAANTFTAKVVPTCGDATHALSFDQGSDVFACQAITATATAGGSNTQFQFNNATALGGVVDLTWNGTHSVILGASGILDLHLAATSGILLPGGFGSGILKVTTTTGAVSSATISTCGDATHAVSYDGTNFGCQAITATATAGGSTTQLQYNNGGALGGVADFTWNGSHTLTGSALAIMDLHLMTSANFTLPGNLITGLVTVVSGTGLVSSVFAPNGAIVGTTDTQTLTNKSINGSEINSGVVASTYGGTGADLHSSTGIVRAGNPFNVSELSGDSVTNGSNVVIGRGINSVLFSGLATGILKNSTGSGVPSIAVAADFPALNQNTTGTALSITGLLIGANFPTLTTGNPVVGGGAGNLPTSGSRSGNTTTFATTSGTLTVGHSVVLDASGNFVDSGSAPAVFGAQGDVYFAGNGTTTSFTPGWTFTSGLMMVFVNGTKQRPSGNDYSISGNNVVFLTAPQTGDTVEVIQ